ncbi:hypothetical protein H4R19_002146 [Coemansia spiralis]|nr:hypothetical protein H4R19_002146 [Coemansia spiralis]
MITASTASSVLLLAVLYCGYMLVGGRPMLRTDRIKRTERAKAVTGATPHGDRTPASGTSSRIALMRAGCRPKSEMAHSRITSTAVSSPAVRSLSAGGPFPTPEAAALLQERLSRVSRG